MLTYLCIYVSNKYFISSILMFLDNVSCSWIVMISGKKREMGILFVPLTTQPFVAQMGKPTATNARCVLRTREYLRQAFSLKYALHISTWHSFFFQSLKYQFILWELASHKLLAPLLLLFLRKKICSATLYILQSTFVCSLSDSYQYLCEVDRHLIDLNLCIYLCVHI